MNTKIQELHKKLVTLINESKLPAGVVLFIMRDCYKEIEQAYLESIQIENQQITEGADTE